MAWSGLIRPPQLQHSDTDAGTQRTATWLELFFDLAFLLVVAELAMVAALELRGGERVLEVGTGLGFQTAILARLARQVVSVERFADLAAQARANLAAAGLGRVTVVVGDGTLGVPEHAPYQAIVVAAASSWVPPPLVEQLAPGGRLVHPVGPGGHEQVTVFHKEAGRLIADIRLTPARFVPLIGAHGSPSRDDQDGR